MVKSETPGFVIHTKEKKKAVFQILLLPDGDPVRKSEAYKANVCKGQPRIAHPSWIESEGELPSQHEKQ